MDHLLGGLSAHGASLLPASAQAAPQLDSLLAAIDTSDADQLQLLLCTIADSNLLHRLPSDQSQHKLTVRINSLISAQKAAGYRLAALWLAQSPSTWNAHLVNHASSWLHHAVNLLLSPATHSRPDADLLDAALSLVGTHILVDASPSRQEFHRQVVTPNLVKYATALFDAAHDIVKDLDVFAHGRALHVLLVAAERHMRIHPASCRALSSRIYTICRKLLYASEWLRTASPAQLPLQLPVPLFVAVVRLLSSLHLTGALSAKASEGGGRTTQVQLWQSTVTGELEAAKAAWSACVSSYEGVEAVAPSSASVASGAAENDGASAAALPPLPEDPLVATQVALGRVELLLGSRGRPGLLPLLLRIPTPRPVPVPVGALLDFALAMLRVGVDTAQKATAELTLCALQAAYLPRHHLAALGLVSQLALLSPVAAALRTSELLPEVCRVAEAAKGDAPRLRMAALRTLLSLVGKAPHGVGLALDPNGRVTLRLARLCSSQVATILLGSSADAEAQSGAHEHANGNNSSASAAASGSSRKAKKARLYESDSVFGVAANPRDAMLRLQPEEIASTQAALQVLEATFPHLTTQLSAQHHDLAHTAAQVVLALVEVLAGAQASPVVPHGSSVGAPPTVHNLFCTALATLSQLLRDSPSSMLALSLPRITPVLVELASAPDNAAIRAAAGEALSSLNLARKGKSVPIARGLGFYPDSNEGNPEFDAVPEGSQLVGGVDRTLELQAERRGAESICNVLKLHPTTTAATGERMDVDAIAAGTHPDNSPFNAASAIGKGLPSPLSRQSPMPHSPPRPSSLRKGRLFSPDPVKPAHRPSTPRIGSPSALDRTVSFGNVQKEAAAHDQPASPRPEIAAAAGAEPARNADSNAGPAVSAAPAPSAPAIKEAIVSNTTTVVTTKEVPVPDVEATAPASQKIVNTTQVIETTASLPHPIAVGDDVDDEEMPEIDMGSSGSEDEDETDHNADESEKNNEDGENILVP
ncbi:hypothetical protein ACQY0O_004273 [Thecaphora frezii]